MRASCPRLVAVDTTRVQRHGVNASLKHSVAGDVAPTHLVKAVTVYTVVCTIAWSLKDEMRRWHYQHQPWTKQKGCGSGAQVVKDTTMCRRCFLATPSLKGHTETTVGS